MTIDNQDERHNLLVALHKWARKQDENFTTEAFVHLLKNWMHIEPKAALAVLGTITHDHLSPTEAECQEFEIIPQRRLEGSQPDFRIDSRNLKDLRIIVEVKVQQRVNWEQIRRHWNALEGSKRTRTCLTLLSRDLIVREGPEAALVNSYVLWHNVAECIRKELTKNVIR
jgi:hypothetical protein